MKTLYVVATPIGNLEDITYRAVKLLGEIPYVICEDTRHTGNLLSMLKTRYNFTNSPKLISLRDYNEANQVTKLIELLKVTDMILVSDAGTPTISDPGYKLIAACFQEKIKVVTVPGANAVISALSIAGLPTDKFVFLGFYPKKGSLKLYSGITNVLYVSTYQFSTCIQKIFSDYPQATIAVCNELTKLHETCIHLSATDPIPNLKGEITLVVNCDLPSRPVG